jgi:phage gp46-like protein
MNVATRLARLEQTWPDTAPLAPMTPVELAAAGGLVLDGWQTQAVSSEATRIALNCARQVGKSTVASVVAVHTVCYEPGSLVLLLSRALRQSHELFRTCLHLYRSLGRPVPAEAESALRLELGNGSRLVSLPGTEATTRGFAKVRRLIIDEASRVPDDVYFSLLPTLVVSGGALMTLSTPFGRRGWWSDAWHSDEPWERYEVTAAGCPRISAADLAQYARTMGQWWYRQEFCCEFLDAEDAVFRAVDIEAAFAADVPPLWETA